MTGQAYLGRDRHGYTYHLHPDRYVYQRRPGTGELVGWYCSLSAWERGMCRVVALGEGGA